MSASKNDNQFSVPIDPSNFDAVELAIQEAQIQIDASQAKYEATLDAQRQLNSCIRRFRSYKNELRVKVRGPFTVTTIMELESQLMQCSENIKKRLLHHHTIIQENLKLIKSYKEVLVLRPDTAPFKTPSLPTASSE